jgi:ABC-type branched-subunit amino acid transport system ATPase component/predicted MFS family arabinose efflux permease
VPPVPEIPLLASARSDIVSSACRRGRAQGGDVTQDEPQAAGVATAGLVQAVLEAEAEREALQAEAHEEVLFADELLPGVGGEQMTLREGVLRGGLFAFVVLVLLQSFDELEGATLGVLAPNIRDSLHISDGTIVFISAASTSFIVLGALPMGWMADRFRRSRIIAISAVIFTGCVFACGLAINAFVLFLGRFGVGVAKSNNGPVQGSLIADAFPIEVRGRVLAATQGAAQAARVLSPAAVGGIAALVGGSESWRWPYFLLGLPMIPLAILSFRLPEPPRGQFEMQDVLGEVVVDHKPMPISFEAAFNRLFRIRTLKTALIAFAALGFGLFTAPVLANLYLEKHFHLGTAGRGLVGSISGVGVLVALPFAAKRYDALYRVDPTKAFRLIGMLIVPCAVIIPIQYAMPNPALFTAFGIVASILHLTAFTMSGPIIQSVVPYRLRGTGAALGSIYIFFVGATGGAILAAFFTDALGPRGTVLLLTVPANLFGGLLLIRGASFIKNDLSMVVADLQEELAEKNRQEQDPDNIPALQVNGVDFSYGHVQVLFDVSFEVHKGEVLALLGTNGAGKSTILRAVAGLGTPSRGVVRLHGQTITFAAPESRVKYGIRLLPGGKGVFPQMTIRENLEMGAYVYRHDPADRERRIARMLELFSALRDRQDELASALSGGQQQMLALAITLLHDPDVLLIDELSLGLSPIVVQELLGVVERLKGEGMTIVIVEQSLNVALAIADRAVFLEKGQVRFQGPAAELATRDDLARAVFLGKEGG